MNWKSSIFSHFIHFVTFVSMTISVRILRQIIHSLQNFKQLGEIHFKRVVSKKVFFWKHILSSNQFQINFVVVVKSAYLGSLKNYESNLIKFWINPDTVQCCTILVCEYEKRKLKWFSEVGKSHKWSSYKTNCRDIWQQAKCFDRRRLQSAHSMIKPN